MTMNDPEQASGSDADRRLSSLEDRLRNAHRAEGELTSPGEVGPSFTGKGVSQGNRVLSSLIGAPLGGLIIGFALDRVFSTAPAAMLVMLFLGIAAGMVQIWRISRERAE